MNTYRNFYLYKAWRFIRSDDDIDFADGYYFIRYLVRATL